MWRIKNLGASYIVSGENRFDLARESSLNRWIYTIIRGGGLTVNRNLSDVYFEFADGFSGFIVDCVNGGYIEPLCIVYSGSTDTTYIGNIGWEDVLNIVDGGGTSIRNYSSAHILFKVRDKSALKAVCLTTNDDWSAVQNSDGLRLYELEYDFELSLQPLI